MHWFISAVERFALALILGAGVFMVAGVRPLLAQLDQPGLANEVALLVGEVRNGVWLRYNRVALLAALALLGVAALRAVAGQQREALIRIGGAVLLALVLVRKDLADRKMLGLYEGAADPGAVVGSPAYAAQVREIMIATVATLALAGLLTLWFARETPQN